MGLTLEVLLRCNRFMIVLGMVTQYILGLVILKLGCYWWYRNLAHCHVEWTRGYLVRRYHKWGQYFSK